MNYSIILLGATISLSLFLRICGVCEAMEVTSTESDYFNLSSLLKEISDHDDITYGWISGDPMYYLKSELKRILMPETVGGKSFQNTDEEAVDKLIADYVSDLSNSRPNYLESTFVWDGGYDEICGAKVRNESNGCVVQENINAGEVPSGCFYEDDTHLILTCNDTTLTRIPPLPLKLQKLDFQQTQIQDLHTKDFGNVTIDHIRFFNNELTTIDTWAFEKVQGLKSLNIVANQIEFLAFEIYLGLTELLSLTLDYNRISFEIYQHCEIKPIEEITLVLPKLKFFSLTGNPLKIIPSQMWAGLRESPVNTLNLSSCSLESIDPIALTFLPRLQTLDLSENPKLIPNLPSAFLGLINGSLQSLSLVDNNINVIPKEALGMISSTLTTLDLSRNQIEYITSTSFSGVMPKLRSLSLEDCKLRSIDIGSLELLPNLSTLILKNNRLIQIPPSISALRGLTYLNLDNNVNNAKERDTLFTIPPYAFVNLTSLSILLLSKVKLQQISNHTFDGLSKLSVLVLDDAQITSIEDASFRDLVSLKSLTIRNNPLNPINSLTFYGLSKLEGLYMGSCGLNFPKPSTNGTESTGNNVTEEVNSSSRMLNKPLIPTNGDPSSPFLFLRSLRWLELPGNNMEHVYPELFAGAENLTAVDLTGNKIQSWIKPILLANYTPGYPNIASRKLLMSNNKLTAITDAMMEDIFNFRPDVVDLTFNPFLCDEGACKYRDMLVLPKNSTDERIKEILGDVDWINLKSYTCTHTDTLQYKIANVTNEICKSFGEYAQEPGPDALPDSDSTLLPSSSKSIVTISVSIVCVTGLIAAAVVTGYKKRVHLKYAWFVAKINIGKLPRKAKTSVVDVIQYDFDIFISYHNSDRDFVQDEFLPEVEESVDQDKSRDIEQAKSKGFRVCLHERDFEAGVPISENIVESVDRSKKVVIVVSKKYLESQWCTYEMNLAYHRLIESRRNSFVLIFLEEIPAELRTKVLNYLMRSRTYLEWPGNKALAQDKKRFWARLTSSLSSSD